MKIEVEQKFPVEDLSAFQQQLEALGATWLGERVEADTYYAHPARDFAQTDEALRIRRVGTSSLLAYKGPKLDPTTKTRRELELPLGSDDRTTADWASLLEVLGFRPVAEVRKNRRKLSVPWQGRQVEASLDEVAEVGTFVELELVTTEADLESAKAVIASLAAQLGLARSERRSYLELLLEE
jgi:adenylate cyclase class 2